MYTNQNIIEGHSNLDKLTKPCHFEFEQPAGTYLLQVSESCLNFTQNVNKPEAPKDWCFIIKINNLTSLMNVFLAALLAFKVLLLVDIETFRVLLF